MKKILVSAALVLSLLSVPAFAKHDGDKHKDKPEKHEFKDKDKHKEHKKEWRDKDRDRDRDHGRVANNGRPPGWDKGKKTGWGNCDVPPGQAKKQGCRSSARQRSVSTRPRTYPARTRTYPPRRTTTTTTTTTTTSNTQPKRSGHPFEPVLREKQQGGKDQRTLKQSVK